MKKLTQIQQRVVDALKGGEKLHRKITGLGLSAGWQLSNGTPVNTNTAESLVSNKIVVYDLMTERFHIYKLSETP